MRSQRKATYTLVDFLSEKFHEKEPDRKRKEEITKSLRGQVLVLQYNLDIVQAQVNEQTQYTCKNCLLFTGTKE